VVFFDNGISSTEVFRFIVMVIASIHSRVKLFEINIFVKHNILPDGSRERVRDRLSLHKVDDSVAGFFSSIGLSKFPGLFQMAFGLRRLEILLQMWGFRKDIGWND
jgi:hypothetical protein